MSRRTIFVGDVHGCFDELEQLLAKLRVSDDDTVFLLGDLTRKGPAPDECVALCFRENVSAILGNQDDALLKRAHRPLPWWLARAPDRRILRRPDLLEEMRRWPLVIDFPQIAVTAVHAGILPISTHFEESLVTREDALTLRYVRRVDGAWRRAPTGKEQDGDRFWSEVWNGDRLVVYGHTPRDEPKIDARAIGLDTGCVYGGKLSAAVFNERGGWDIESIPARQKYSR